MKKLKIVLVIITLSLLAWVSYITYPQTNTEAVQQTKVYQTVTVSELHELVNLERSKAGLQPLVLDERLNKSACNRAETIDSVDDINHNGYEASIIAQVNDWSSVGENLSESNQDAGAVVSGWMGSQLHKENILDKEFTNVGYCVKPLGFEYLGNNDMTLVVQHFLQ